MKRLKTFLIMVVIFSTTATFAQVNPFAKYGYDVKVLTMTNGRFNEFFDMDTVVQIGDLLFNTNSMKIIGFAEKDSITPMPDASVISRWVSPDPLAEEYWSLSPYNYCLNDPILFVDPNGMWVVNIISNTDDDGNTTYSLNFTAEKDDNIETLSKQLGVSVDYLNGLSELDGADFSEGNSFGLNEIGIVSNINSFLNGDLNSEDANCRYFAMSANGLTASDKFNTDPSFLDDFSNVPASQASIGDIVTYDGSYEDFEFQWWGEAEGDGYTKESFKEYFNENFSHRPAHYSVVLLKSKDGSSIQSVAEKPGILKARISPYQGVPSNEDGRANIYLFIPNSTNPNHSSPIYKKNE